MIQPLGILFAITWALCAVSAVAQMPSQCDPPCTGANTFCPADAFEHELYDNPWVCHCLTGYTPFVPLDVDDLDEYRCLPACPLDHVRPPGTENCEECAGEDSEPDYYHRRCLTRSCHGMAMGYNYGSCNHLKQVATVPSNGCTIPDDVDIPGWVSERWLTFFGPACDEHDGCYGTCGTSRGECDQDWHDHARRLCRAEHPVWDVLGRAKCYAYALAGYRGARNHGGPLFDRAQTGLCHCCSRWS